MKIMFATDENIMDSKIAKRFGHAPFYIIYNTEDKSIDARVNNGHDDNHSSLVDLMNEGVTEFVIGNIGPQAFEVLKDGNAKIYLARKLNADEALNKLLDKTLEELEQHTLKRSIEPHDHDHGEGHNHNHKDGHHHNGGNGHKHNH
ncbi:MAG: dinitrogenase iron-molybdenum cofactor biosynthesis protein [Ignavibacteriae bacterium]|nr:dinitrogenase iron-molybdenum cofactor biosynthesis protein [Ignavibacteriota bacterium]